MTSNLSALLSTPWPAGVLYRYLTLFGATVDITKSGDYYVPTCTGCDASTLPDTVRKTQDWAQAHSARCRALPHPA
ncbi:hypothetical protein [Actinacidiphila glaucinigra]|uniref:hypothetical protein n=1 Tax=Actinacidiphila glaucinigra TaxID=235986 RepID=UPI0035E1CCCE